MSSSLLPDTPLTASPPLPAPFIEVTGGSLLDQDITIVICHLNPNDTICIRAETFDDADVQFASRASFRADEYGVVDLSTQAPLEGTYSGVDPMGILWSMKAQSGQPAVFSGKKELSVLFTVVRDQQEIVTKEIVRQFKTPDVKRIEIRENGLVGTLFLPSCDKPLPVIITLNGSSGGIGEGASQLLASHGFAVFALGYFGMEGLPDVLQNFPLEYFEMAFRWLKAQSTLNGSIGLYGRSRGGELVLILGAWFPELIQAVVAVVPSSVITSGEGDDIYSHAWFYQGKPLAPFAPQSQINFHKDNMPLQNFLDGTGEDLDHPGSVLRSFLEGIKDKESFQAAAIPVEKIQSPLLVISGGDDQMWPSTFYATQIEERLREHHSSIPYTHLHYPEAGHMITMPNIPQPGRLLYHSFYKLWIASGGTPAANRYACIDSWRKLISFFEKHLKTGF